MTAAQILARALTPPSKNPIEGEFVPSHVEVTPGHGFDYKGSKWRVTWCQPLKPSGWLLMIVPERSKP